MTSMGARKFSRASLRTLFVFAESIMIISIRRNKRGGLAMDRSDFTVMNVSYSAFFNFDDHFGSSSYSRKGLSGA